MTDEERFLAEQSVSRETLDRLRIYADLLARWNPSINLVSSSSLDNLWTRHFLDSAQILDLAAPDTSLWADLGTGGGFPGMIVAIIAAERRPEIKVVCVESDTRKATFLRTVAREAGVIVEVLSKRIESLPPLGAAIVSARALAPLNRLLSFAERHLAPGGEAIFLKGAQVEAEIAEALETWAFTLDRYPSLTDPAATILKLGEIRRA